MMLCIKILLIYNYTLTVTVLYKLIDIYLIQSDYDSKICIQILIQLISICSNDSNNGAAVSPSMVDTSGKSHMKFLESHILSRGYILSNSILEMLNPVTATEEEGEGDLGDDGI